jgi:hypothetical protein
VAGAVRDDVVDLVINAAYGELLTQAERTMLATATPAERCEANALLSAEALYAMSGDMPGAEQAAAEDAIWGPPQRSHILDGLPSTAGFLLWAQLHWPWDAGIRACVAEALKEWTATDLRRLEQRIGGALWRHGGVHWA